MLFGHTSNNRPSRFAGEIPAELLEQSGRSYLDPAPAGDGWDDFDQTPRVSTYREPYRQGGAYQSYGGGERRSVYTPPRPQKPAASVPGPSLPDYQKGDMLEHKAFGRGMVTSAQKMGGDVLLEIAFDGVGAKRLMLKTSAQYLKKL